MTRVPPSSLGAGPAACILIFVRAPEPGRVKTRLAAEIGAAAALRVYRRLAEHAVQEALAVGSAAVRVHFTPGDAGDVVRGWLGAGPDYLPQAASGDLGARMRAAFEEAFAAGYRRVVVIGSDLPGLSAELLRRAIGLLDGHRVVVGPAADGGYYLLGMTERVGALFEGVPWSTDQVLARTLEILRSMEIAPALLPRLRDVDTVHDLPPGWREWAASEDTDRGATG